MRVLAVIFFALALGSGAARAGPNGAIELYNYMIDPQTGSATVVDYGSYQTGVTVLFGGFLGKVVIGVYARLSGASQAGISGAEFYLRGLETGAACQLPAGWTASVVFPPHTIHVGALSTPRTHRERILRRLNLAWEDVTGPDAPACQKQPLTELARVELHSAWGFETTFGGNHFVSVVGGDPPSNALFACPVLVLCDFPVFTFVCVTGGQFVINPGGRHCTVAVEGSTWSHVKSLYRD